MENVEYDYCFKVLASKTSVTDESCAFQQNKPKTRHHDLLFEFLGCILEYVTMSL